MLGETRRRLKERSETGLLLDSKDSTERYNVCDGVMKVTLVMKVLNINT